MSMVVSHALVYLELMVECVSGTRMTVSPHLARMEQLAMMDLIHIRVSALLDTPEETVNRMWMTAKVIPACMVVHVRTCWVTTGVNVQVNICTLFLLFEENIFECSVFLPLKCSRFKPVNDIALSDTCSVTD